MFHEDITHFYKIYRTYIIYCHCKHNNYTNKYLFRIIHIYIKFNKLYYNVLPMSY